MRTAPSPGPRRHEWRDVEIADCDDVVNLADDRDMVRLQAYLLVLSRRAVKRRSGSVASMAPPGNETSPLWEWTLSVRLREDDVKLAVQVVNRHEHRSSRPPLVLET